MQGCRPCLAHTSNQWWSLLPASPTPRYTTGSIFLSHQQHLVCVYVCHLTRVPQASLAAFNTPHPGRKGVHASLHHSSPPPWQGCYCWVQEALPAVISSQ